MTSGGAVEMRLEGFCRALLQGVVDPVDPSTRRRVDLGVVLYFEDERPLRGLGALLDWRLGGALSSLLRRGWAQGRVAEATLMPGRLDFPTDRLVLLGLGPAASLTADAAAVAARRGLGVALDLHPTDVLFALPTLVDERDVVEAMFLELVAHLGAVGPRPPADDAILVPESAAQLAPDGTTPPPAAPMLRDGPTKAPWWVAADTRHVGRLRRLLDGPPRPATPQ